MRALCCWSLAVLAASASAQKDGPVQLTEPKSGVTVTLPKDWRFAAGETGLVAVNADESAMVALAACQKFGDDKPNVQTSLRGSKLRDLEIEEASMASDRDRGALAGLITVKGSGIDEKGDKVSFSASIVKSGDIAGVAIGSWKNAESAAVVKSILEEVCIQQPKSKAGLVLSEPSTGAAVTLPAGWVTVASKKGVIAWDPNRTAMALILRPQEDFASAVTRARQYLRERVFDDVEISEFGEVSATDATAKTTFARLVGATGTAKDRVDQQPVEFRVLAVQRPEQDHGTLILGAWKNDAGEAAVQKMLDSIHVAKAPPKQDKQDKQDK